MRIISLLIAGLGVNNRNRIRVADDVDAKTQPSERMKTKTFYCEETPPPSTVFRVFYIYTYIYKERRYSIDI